MNPSTVISVLIPEDVEIRPVVGRELRAIDGPDLGEDGFAMALPPIERGHAEVVPFVVPAQIAEGRGRKRTLRQFPVPLAIEQRVQANAGIRGGRLCAGGDSHSREHKSKAAADCVTHGLSGCMIRRAGERSRLCNQGVTR